jgi:hypothetical protein
MHGHVRYTASFSSLALGLCIFLGCDTGIIPQKPAVSARYGVQASACEVEVRFAGPIVTREPLQQEYYRLASGPVPIATEHLPADYAVALTFAEPVTPGELVEIGANTGSSLLLPVTANPADAEPAQLLAMRFPADGAQPTVALIFDEALDPDNAGDPSHYALAGTIDHPVSATVSDCGKTITLVFEELSAVTTLDIDGLKTVNGLFLENSVNLPVEAAPEESRPQIEAAAYAADSEAASIVVTFSEAVDRQTATDVNLYCLSSTGLQPSAAALEPTSRSVILSFDALEPPVSLDVDGIVDLNKNPMLPANVEVQVNATDQSAPDVTSAAVAGRGDGLVVRVAFSEAVTRSSAGHVGSYLLISADGAEYITPSNVALLPGGAGVELTFKYVPNGALLEVEGVTDLCGNAIDGKTIVTLNGNSDGVAPSIIAATFVADANVPTIHVVFDKPLDKASAEDTANYVLGTDESPSSAVLLDDGRTVRLTAPPVARTAKLSVSSVADETGNVMPSVPNQPIVAAQDETTPQVVSVDFAPDQTTPTIQVVFSEAVDKATAENANNYTSTAGSARGRAATLQPDGHTVWVTFGPLPFNTELTATNVTDLSGNAVDAATLPVGGSLDEAPPAVESSRFVQNPTTPTLEVRFTEAVDLNLAESTNLYLLGEERIPAAAANLSEDGRTVRLEYQTMNLDDTLQVRSIIDLSGNMIEPMSDLGIEPATDNIRPFLVSAAFTANPSTPTVIVTFSEAVDRSTAEPPSSYQTSITEETALTAVLQEDSRTVHLTFPPMASQDQLLLDGISDFGGNQVDPQFATLILPAADTTAPTIVSATVSHSQTITIEFSEVVDATTAIAFDNYTVRRDTRIIETLIQLPDGKRVRIFVTGGAISAGDTITVENVTDLNGNIMAAVASRELE